MTSDDIQLLFEYDRWANGRVLRSVAPLPDEQFTRDLGGSFRSIRDTLLHMIAGEWIWLAYWKDPLTGKDSESDLAARRERIFNPANIPDLSVLTIKWKGVEAELAEFVDSQTDASLNELLPFRGTQVKLIHLMQHVVNHSTYHRGQVALMLRQLGIKPLATDFHEFLVDRTTPPMDRAESE